IPPISSLMPHPCPAVSPVHTKLCADDAGTSPPLLVPPVRPLPLTVPASGAVRKLPLTASPAAPPSSSKLISSANRVLDGRFPAWILAVKSDAWVARGPRRTRSKAPRPRRTWPASSTARRTAVIRPAPEARDQRTAESEVTSPVAMPLGRVSRLRTSATPAGDWVAAEALAAGTEASAAARTELLTMVRRETPAWEDSVMSPAFPGPAHKRWRPGEPGVYDAQIHPRRADSLAPPECGPRKGISAAATVMRI